VRTAPILIPENALRERLAEMERLVDEHAATDGEDDRKVRLARRLLLEMFDAIESAKSFYVDTAVAAKLCGCDARVLQRRARAAARGESLPRGWERLEVRRAGRTWEIRVSTLPARLAA
jgi:hypothetical protein